MDVVYVETSIPSYYFERRAVSRIVAWKQSTRRWWDSYRSAFELCTSRITLEELARAPGHKSGPGLDLLRNVRLLELTDAVRDAAMVYIEHMLVPRDALADALHLAFASVHRTDYLLTWNIKHLANVNKRRHLSVINTRLGLGTPEIVTPDIILPEEPHAQEVPHPG